MAPRRSAQWLGPHGTIVLYPLRGEELINVVCHYDDASYRHESWIAECSREEVLERYAGWHESLLRLFAAADTWYKWALYDRDPIPRWTRGRVAVLGDAAHPMLPYLGQGACQAIEDGAVLATALVAEAADPVTGLLQTEDYARHIISSYSRVEPIPPALIGRLVRVRMRRQEVLNREGLQVSVVLDESVLKRRIGNDAIMYDQLQRLAREAERPNLTLQILPLSAQHVVFGESFVIFGFGYDSEAMLQDVVVTEQLKNSFTLEGERETYLHRIAFQMLANASLDPAESRELILDTAESYWSGARRPAHV